MLIPTLTSEGLRRAFLYIDSGSTGFVFDDKEMPYWFEMRLRYIEPRLLSRADLYIFHHKCNMDTTDTGIAGVVGCSLPTVKNHFEGVIKCLHGQDYLTKGYTFAEIEHQLATTDISNLFCSNAQQSSLRRCGVYTIGELVAEMKARFSGCSASKCPKVYSNAMDGLIAFLNFCDIDFQKVVCF